jgi:hypothetical protein
VTAMTLSEQLAAADRAAAPLTQRVATLEAELRAAIDTGDFARAHQLQAELAAVRDDQVVALAAVSALREGAAAVARAHAEDQQRLADAQQRARAVDDLAEATAAAQRGMAAINASIERMFELLREAKAELFGAIATEYSVGQARQAANLARDAASERPTGMVPRASAPNRASALAEQDPLVSQLARWSR